MLLEQNSNRYMQKCIFSMAGICNGTEGKFSDEFENIMECAHISEKFQSARGKHEKEFELEYLLHCFFDANDKPFPNNDDRCGVMCDLAALQNAAALRCRKIQLNDGTTLEYMFCPHCSYFANNLTTMNTHVRKHYKVGLFCANSKCNFITNRIKVMLQHRTLIHGYGKKTAVKSKS